MMRNLSDNQIIEQIASANALRNKWKENDAKRDFGVGTPTVREINNVSYINSENEDNDIWHKMNIYYPKNKEKDSYPVIINVHGGGFFYGDKELYSLYTKNLADRGFAVVNFNYRLAPENKYPAAFYDVCYLVEFIIKNAEKYKFDLTRLYMIGDSAGAFLVCQYSIFASNDTYKRIFKNLEVKTAIPKKVVLNCGIYNLDLKLDGEMCDWYLENEISDEYKNSVFKLLDYLNNDFPYAFIMTSVNDPLRVRTKCLLDTLERLNKDFIYREYGYDTPNDAHVFHLDMNSKAGIECNEAEIAFLKNNIF